MHTREKEKRECTPTDVVPNICLCCLQEGQELIQEKPELRPVVQQKLGEIRECWSDLETTTKAKARQLFENNKPEPAVKSYSDLDSQLSHLERQPPQLEQAHHLPTFNEQLQKFQVIQHWGLLILTADMSLCGTYDSRNSRL